MQPRSARSIGTGLLPLVDIVLGNRLRNQMIDRRHFLAGEVVCGDLCAMGSSVTRYLRGNAVFLARADGLQSVRIAIAADDNQFSLLEPERDSGGFGSALDRDRFGFPPAPNPTPHPPPASQ